MMAEINKVFPFVRPKWEFKRPEKCLNEMRRWIETTQLKFILAGSSARKLRQQGTNLLAGRAHQLCMHPLTAEHHGRKSMGGGAF